MFGFISCLIKMCDKLVFTLSTSRSVCFVFVREQLLLGVD